MRLVYFLIVFQVLALLDNAFASNTSSPTVLCGSIMDFDCNECISSNNRRSWCASPKFCFLSKKCLCDLLSVICFQLEMRSVKQPVTENIPILTMEIFVRITRPRSPSLPLSLQQSCWELVCLLTDAHIPNNYQKANQDREI